MRRKHNDTSDLPAFATHPGHSKSRPLLTVAEYHVESAIWELLAEASTLIAGRDIRVLDLGCGRGELTACLLQRGWDAWGADVVPEYLEHGRRYLRSKGFSTERLVDMGDPSRLADNSFNVVISNQVLEHVADLQSFVATVARVSTPGALGLHIFPGRWILIEPHIRAPLFHWLPKGPARRLALRAVIAAGVGVDYFSEFQPHERLEIFVRYSEMHTFYRSRSTISATFARAGMSCEFTTVAPDRQVPAGLARNAAHLVAGRSALVGMTHLRTNI